MSGKRVIRPQLVALFFALRICRTQIRQKRFAQAALFFASAVGDLFAARRKETAAATEEAAALATFTFVEPALASLTDSELVECFAAVESQFKDKSRVRAWILFKELELLFDRMLVQKGKAKLLEAEALALSLGERDLLLQIRHKKLFVRFEQMYSNQINWVRDVLEHGLLLGSDDALTSWQDGFGKNILNIAERMLDGPMRDVALRISGNDERWRHNPFVFSLLALWSVSRHHRLRIAALDQIQTYLRNAANVLKEDDFK